MYLSIMTIGKPGGCKSTANATIQYEFRRQGITPVFVSDRLLLEAKVMEDTKDGIRKPDGAIEGEHSIMFDGNKPAGRKVFEIKDGSLLNRVHDEMVAFAGSHREPQGVVFEYATGPDVFSLPREPLFQSGESLIKRFGEYPITPGHRVVVVEIDASLDERLRRNGQRVDGMREETFRKFFPDGGELREQGSLLDELGVSFYRIDNDHDDLSRFVRDVGTFCDTRLRPLLMEGNYPRPEVRF